MPDITRSAASMSDMLPPPSFRLSELRAGETIEPGHVCRIHSDGLVRLTNGAIAPGGAGAAGNYDGVALEGANAGEAITLGRGVVVKYTTTATPLVPGTRYYPSATIGALADAAAAGAHPPIAHAVSTTEVHFYWPNR